MLRKRTSQALQVDEEKVMAKISQLYSQVPKAGDVSAAGIGHSKFEAL